MKEENVFWRSGRVKITREDDHYIIQFDTEDDLMKDISGEPIYSRIPSWKIPVKVLAQYPPTDNEFPLMDLAHSLMRLNKVSNVGDRLERNHPDKDWGNWKQTYNKDLEWYN